MTTGRTGSLNEVEALFRDSVPSRKEMKPARDAGWFILMALAAVCAGVAVFAGMDALATSPHGFPSALFLRNPFATAESILTAILLMSLSLVGAYNPDIRRDAVAFLMGALVLLVSASLLQHQSGPQSSSFPEDQAILMWEAILGGAMLCTLLIPLLTGRPVVGEEGLTSRMSAVMGVLLTAYGVMFAGLGLVEVFSGSLFPAGSDVVVMTGSPLPLVPFEVTKSFTMAGMFFFLARRPPMQRFFLPVLVLVLSAGAAAGLMGVLHGDTVVVTGDNGAAKVDGMMGAYLLLSGGSLAIVLWLRRMQYRVDYRITSVGPGSAECVMALHRSLREAGQKPEASVREVLLRVDEYVAGIRGRERGIIGLPFWMVEFVFPLLAWLRPPFSTMSREEQRWMMRRYLLRPNYERARSLVPALADAMFMIGDSVHSLMTFGYYSSATGQAETGYILPNARARLQPDLASHRPPDFDHPSPLPGNLADPAGRKPGVVGSPFFITPRVSIPPSVPSLPDEVDYCIVGSGAAGGVLAYRLSVAGGKSNSICVLEKGGFHSPLQDFNDDEMRMICALYADGGLQSTRSLDFTILQGECVGGSTVINNALCFEMPDVSKAEWQRFGVDTESLGLQYARVAEEIGISEMAPEAVNHKVEEIFIRGVDAYNLASPATERVSPARRMQGNFSNCVGCGLCNIGCRRLRKMSVLETYLPWAEARGVKVIPYANAVRCETAGPGGRKKVTSVLVRTQNGDLHTLRVRKALIVSAGAIASSRFLMRSGIGGGSVGKGLACNFAFPLVVEFDDEIHAFDGLQMTMFAARENHEAVFETTFNPPGTQSVMLAQYFDHHRRMMEAYTRSMVIIALVGSDPSGAVSSQPSLLYGRAVDWNQTPDEITRIKRAFSAGVRIAREAGASRVLLPTLPVLELPCDGETGEVMDTFNAVIDDRKYFRFATPHPQGGNMMAADEHDERVVGTDFRVRGCENLFVCDASVFPRGIRVNPQWTVFALASAAGDRIASVT